MVHIIEAFLAAEFSCLPQFLDKYMGKYYSTKISNGATWVFFMWHIIHFLFEESINLLLKQMKIKEYVRVRLKHSIWYLGFYTVCFAYCLGTLYSNNIDIFSHRKLLTIDNEMVPGYLILGFVLLCTFYAHSIIWEGLKKGFSMSLVSYSLLVVFILTTYFSRKVELSLSLLTIVSFTQFGVEMARCCHTLLKSNGVISSFILKTTLGLAILLFILTHLFIIPLFFLFPLMYSFLWESQSSSIITFNVILWLWLFCEIINNPLYKLIRHWLDHNSSVTNKDNICPGTALECALFQTRDDEAYNMQLIRRAIKEREARLIALRKPKSRSMLLQTLKCMVAIKRKIKEKRSNESSDDSEEESEEYSETDRVETEDKECNSDDEDDDTNDMNDDREVLVKNVDNEDRESLIKNSINTVVETIVGNDEREVFSGDSKIFMDE
nr:uncharacterized protein LOC111428560 isoform X1 [Onthophagus taurus]